jgi:hypothetical protein
MRRMFGATLFVMATIATAPASSVPLRDPQNFSHCAAGAARARALFSEASRVFVHPRCVNCHPAGDAPMQGDGSTPHEPPVWRGVKDQGVPGLECTSCHQDRNTQLARVPGAPKWHLAPLSMAWAGKSTHDICEAIKDRARNGGMTLPQIIEHVAHDSLVGWGWEPGADRAPAPGPRAIFAALVSAWVDEGAACPESYQPNPVAGDCP